MDTFKCGAAGAVRHIEEGERSRERGAAGAADFFGGRYGRIRMRALRGGRDGRGRVAFRVARASARVGEERHSRRFVDADVLRAAHASRHYRDAYPRFRAGACVRGGVLPVRREARAGAGRRDAACVRRILDVRLGGPARGDRLPPLARRVVRRWRDVHERGVEPVGQVHFAEVRDPRGEGPALVPGRACRHVRDSAARTAGDAPQARPVRVALDDSADWRAARRRGLALLQRARHPRHADFRWVAPQAVFGGDNVHARRDRVPRAQPQAQVARPCGDPRRRSPDLPAVLVVP